MTSQLASMLTGHKLRLTVARKRLFEVLSAASGALELGELVKLCKGVDRVSIYRNLELFGQLGMVEVVHIGWKKRYELSSLFSPHHHHLHCHQCGKLVHIDSPEIERLIERLAASRGFRVTSHNFEVSGVCRQCQLPA